ncbi:MAG TPA: DMT family transporter [Crocinitomix sp.]|nr:DMT family transporter [Crocinitomix sp.]
MLISSLSFAIVNLMVKLLTNSYQLFPSIQDYPPYELVFFRSIISLSISIVIIKYRGIPMFGYNKKWLLIRGVFGATALLLFFYTLKNLPIAVATTVQYLSPIFTIILAIFINHQKVKSIQWLFFLIAFSGVIFIGFGKSNDSRVIIEPIWLILGVVSAMLSGVAYNAIIKCRATDEPITIVMYFPLVATPIMFFIMIYNGYVIPKGYEWGLLLLIGIFTQIAQVFMTRAFHFTEASKVTPIKYFGAIYAVLIGYFIFDETLSLYVSFGISLILIGVLLNTFLVKRKKIKP